MRELIRIFSLLMALRLVWEDQKRLQRLGLLAIVHAGFVLGHEDH